MSAVHVLHVCGSFSMGFTCALFPKPHSFTTSLSCRLCAPPPLPPWSPNQPSFSPLCGLVSVSRLGATFRVRLFVFNKAKQQDM